MKDLYELKEKLCDELKSYGKKELSTGSLDVVDKLSHTVKNLDKIIEKYEDQEGGYSGRGGGRSYENMGSYGRSNARGRSSRRDSRGRYSRGESSYDGYSYDEDMISELRELMMNAPDENTRQEFKRFIQKMESM